MKRFILRVTGSVDIHQLRDILEPEGGVVIDHAIETAIAIDLPESWDAESVRKLTRVHSIEYQGYKETAL